MKYLLKIVSNKTDYEPKKVRKSGHPLSKTIYLCYKINGYWFRLSRIQWSEHLCIGYGIITYRHKAGKTTAEILGFKKIKRVSNLSEKK